MSFEIPFHPHQIEGIERFLTLERQIIAFGTGMGKTYTALGGIEAIRRKFPDQKVRAIIISTKTAATQWPKQARKFNTGFSTMVCKSASTEEDFERFTELYDLTICPFSVIQKAYVYLRKIYADSKVILIIDEMHKLKNPETTFTSMARVLRDYSSLCWGLTATPLLNHIEDLYWLLHFMKPGYMGDLDTFKRIYTVQERRYVGKGRCVWEVIGFQNLEHLKQKTSKYLLSHFPVMDIRFQQYPSAMNPEDEKLYYIAAKGALADEGRGFAQRLPDLQLVTDGAVDQDRVPRTYDYPPNQKERVFLETVESMLSQKKAVIVYSCYRETLYRLRDLVRHRFTGLACYTITGETELYERAEIEHTFKEQEILFMTGAGGESLNLQVSNDLIMYNLTWSIGDFIQVVGRIARMDSVHDHFNVHIMQAIGTIDDYKWKLIEHHSDKIRSVIADNSSLPKSDGDTSRQLIIEMRRDLLWKTTRGGYG